ncbi:regulator of chromosome condensation 1/beta-lactamase-inhibitor protein II [Sporodiniella umbellata]|nr:regulator of chromosome condensation 1/beta-lactamase-inhibitor protein II [Sporodiniella umbellata]
MSVVYGLGSNGQGQLGIGHLKDVSEPVLCSGLPEKETVVKISGGGNHSVVLLASGRVFTSGFSQSGERLGQEVALSSEEIQSEWTRYRETGEGRVWKDVGCGWAVTVLVSEDGRVFMRGSLGRVEIAEWTEQAMPERIRSVACGWRHVVVLGESGLVYGWGGGRRGQLGGTVDVERVQRLEGVPGGIVQIACGHMFTLLRAVDGTVYGLGSNKYGPLGETPPIVSRGSLAIDAGWHHTFSLQGSEGLQGLGKQDHGQLAQTLGTVEQFCCGSEHSLALKDGTLYGWGWNEHGNCASTQAFTRQPVVIARGLPITVLGAGCATSWFACRSQQKIEK